MSKLSVASFSDINEVDLQVITRADNALYLPKFQRSDRIAVDEINTGNGRVIS